VKPKIEISIVVPLYNEGHNLEELFSELDNSMLRYGKSYEVIFVDDGSVDNSYETLLSIEERKDYVHTLSFKKNVGKAGALEQGFKIASGEKVIILDCDLQYDPNDIGVFLEKIEEGYDVVSGKRVNREDSKRVKVASWLFRVIVAKLSGLNFSDYFSGLKCFRASVINQLGVYGALNRIFAVYAYRAGFKVCEIPITHRQRRHGSSKYNFFGRLKLAVTDLAVLFYTVIVTREKLYKVGLLGFFFLSSGALILLASLFLFLLLYETAKGFWGNSLLFIAVLFVYVGWQLRVIEIVGKEFLERHIGAQIFKEHGLKMSNIKYITPEKREYFERKKYIKPGFHELV
jgi:glycosyltransferase involved in cell wall biosynthesis